MIRKLLAWLGYEVYYIHPWGTWDYRYTSIDAAMCRPIHSDMSVAPPTAKRVIARRK